MRRREEERVGGEGGKEGPLSYSLGRREVEGPDLYVRRKPQCMACLPALLQDLCRKKREGGVPRKYREIFGCKIPTCGFHCLVEEDFLGL